MHIIKTYRGLAALGVVVAGLALASTAGCGDDAREAAATTSGPDGSTGQGGSDAGGEGCLVAECGSDDPCYSDATNAAPEYGAFKTACEAKFDGCPDIGNKVDDICWGTAAASSALIAELSACLDKSCTEVVGCGYAVFDKANACD